MKLTYLIAALITVASVAAIQEVSVAQGGSLDFQNSVLVQGQLVRSTIAYSIPEVGFFQTFEDSNYPPVVQTDTLTFNIPPGDYTLNIVIEANSEVISRSQVLVHVLAKQTSKQTVVVPAQPSVPRAPSAITIPAIPDTTPGTTLVIPVTITGSGSYQLEIPKLAFGSYEMPSQVYVNGEYTVPVLLRVDKTAAPGIYVIPVTAGGESTSVRIRIIKYVGESYWWLLIPIAAVLIIVGALLILTQRTRTRPPKEDGELITYY